VAESLKFEIDWTLGQVPFRVQIRKMIKLARDKGKVLTLPLFPDNGNAAIGFITLILSQVNCDRCDSPCCKSNPQGDDLCLVPSEYDNLKAEYGDKYLRANGEGYFIKMPCGFLGSGNLCTIYPDRPLACVFYPFQPGGSEGDGREAIALASSCSEARRVTKTIYMTSWRIRQAYSATHPDEFSKAFGGT